MDDFCVNCKLFRNLSNKLEKIDLHQLSQHYIDKGYGFNNSTQREEQYYGYIEAWYCEYCKTISFKEQQEEED